MSDRRFSGPPMFISWIGHHGRSEGLARELGIRCEFVPGGSGTAPRRYVRQWGATARLLREARPGVVIVMQPPVVALLAAWLLTLGRARLIGDLHSGVFLDPKWRWATKLTLWMLRGRNAAVVTNETLAEQARSSGVRTVVAHDLIENLDTSRASRPDSVGTVTGGYLLVPLAYANDEPLDELLAAAESTPDLTWVLTGRAPADYRRRAPRNVLFSGFVDDGEYLWLLAHSGVILALTQRHDTMQRAGYEAMAARKALVTFDAAVLHDYFGSAAVYTDCSAGDIVDAVRSALKDITRLEQQMTERRAARMAEQSLALEEIRRLLR